MKTKIINRFSLLLVASSFFLSCEDSAPDAPKEIISAEQAREMYDAYSQRRVPIIQRYEDSVVPGPENFTPTRYAEYDLETIKQYIAYIEHKAGKANVDISTLRFYFANYPNSDKFGNGETVKYPRRNSFFVVPTIQYGGRTTGFSVEEVDGKFSAVPISRKREQREGQEIEKDSMGQVDEAGFFMLNSANSTTVAGGTASLILNDTQLAPPPGSDDFGDGN